MAGRKRSAELAAALSKLPQTERMVLLAMLDEEASYSATAARFGIAIVDAERAFAAALVELAEALDASPPEPGVRRVLRRIAAAARLARRELRR